MGNNAALIYWHFSLPHSLSSFSPPCLLHRYTLTSVSVFCFWQGRKILKLGPVWDKIYHSTVVWKWCQVYFSHLFVTQVLLTLRIILDLTSKARFYNLPATIKAIMGPENCRPCGKLGMSGGCLSPWGVPCGSPKYVPSVTPRRSQGGSKCLKYSKDKSLLFLIVTTCWSAL